jgi:hypothetical protein
LNKSLNGIHHLDINLVQERIADIKEIQKLAIHKKIELRGQWLDCLRDIWRKNLDINYEIAFHIASSLYLDYLPEWFKFFSKEQLLILKSEDLFTDPATTMKQAYHFLGLPDHPLTEYRNANRNKYPPISPSLYQQLADFFRPYNQELEDYLHRKFHWD